MAQRRRKEQLAKQKQRRSILLCIGGGIGAMLLSLIICIIVFGIPSESEPVSAPVSTLIPYDVTQPFSTSDLTSAQMNQLRASGRISVSDGPRGISWAIHWIRCSHATQAPTPTYRIPAI